MRLEAFVVSLTFCSVWLFTGSKIRPNYLQTRAGASRIQNAALPPLSRDAVSGRAPGSGGGGEESESTARGRGSCQREPLVNVLMSGRAALEPGQLGARVIAVRSASVRGRRCAHLTRLSRRRGGRSDVGGWIHLRNTNRSGLSGQGWRGDDGDLRIDVGPPVLDLQQRKPLIELILLLHLFSREVTPPTRDTCPALTCPPSGQEGTSTC